MFLKYRPAKVQDLDECFLCLRDRFAYDEPARRDLMALWREGLQAGTLHMLVMEDLDRPPGCRIFYFAFKACLTDDFACCLRAGAAPLVGRQVLDLWRCGRSPLLTFEQIRAVNSGQIGDGLCMITLYSGAPAFMTGQDYALMTTKSVEWGAFSTSGYRVREYFMELYGETEWAWPEGAGFLLRQDHALTGDVDGISVTLGKRPRLYGISPPEIHVASTPAMILQWQPPRLFFTPAEQELLLWALGGDTDEELAEQMSVALITVKKRWESIYKRVEAVAPEILDSTGTEMMPQKRGGEKKRRLLAYLRHHMEELRPLLPPKR